MQPSIECMLQPELLACVADEERVGSMRTSLAQYAEAAGVAIGSASAPPAPGAGPFEEGVAAYDRGRFDLAYALWLPLAEQGRAAAQFNVAALLENGQGVARNEVEAARWYLKAAEQGDPEAQFKAGWLYEQGRGVPLDLAKAKYWYAKLLGNARAATAAPESLRLARERLARVSRVESAEDVFAYAGGRFVVRNAESGDCVVALQGAVNRDASAAFDKVLAETERRRCTSPATLLLESPGGVVSDGLWLGAKVRRGGFRTIARYGCASSCAIIFLGGVERSLLGARAAIGFHQAAWRRDLARDCEPPDSRVSLEIRDYFRQVIPATADQVFQLAMNTSCNSIEWVRGQRAIDLGVATKVNAESVDLFGPKTLREQK